MPIENRRSKQDDELDRLANHSSHYFMLEETVRFLFDVVVDNSRHFFLPNLQSIHADIILNVFEWTTKTIHLIAQCIQSTDQFTGLETNCSVFHPIADQTSHFHSRIEDQTLVKSGGYLFDQFLSNTVFQNTFGIKLSMKVRHKHGSPTIQSDSLPWWCPLRLFSSATYSPWRSICRVLTSRLDSVRPAERILSIYPFPHEEVTLSAYWFAIEQCWPTSWTSSQEWSIIYLHQKLRIRNSLRLFTGCLLVELSERRPPILPSNNDWQSSNHCCRLDWFERAEDRVLMKARWKRRWIDHSKKRPNVLWGTSLVVWWLTRDSVWFLLAWHQWS